MNRKLPIFIGLILIFLSCSESKKPQFDELRQFVYVSALQITNFFDSKTYSPSKNKKAAPTVVGDFVLALSNGKCDEAIKSTTGRAEELVQSSIDAGCQPYETIIRSMDCDISESGNSALCACEEERSGMSMIFNYELQLIKRNWKIENYQKDFETDSMDGESED